MGTCHEAAHGDPAAVDPTLSWPKVWYDSGGWGAVDET